MSQAYSSPVPAQPNSPSSPGAKLAFHLQNGHTQSMDGRQSEYQQPDQSGTAQYPQGQDPRSANFSSSATPTSEYGNLPQSARSGSFPEYIQRGQTYPPSQGTPGGNMAHATNPSIAAASPTYPPHQQYSPHQYMTQDTRPYPMNPSDFGQPHGGWPGHYQTPHIPHYGHASSGPPTPAMVSPVARPPAGGHPLSTVYSFVPIPGAQQHKRPRRRYEEIERMYKCGWNGCEKAYGTLNHLNAHVTMQSHGPKRTPEEFKEIRKEWKAKKKEEEAQRKAEEERQRQQAESRSAEQQNTADQPVYGHMRTPIGPPPTMGGPQLPPIGYGAPSSGGQSQPQYAQQSPALENMAQYANNVQLYSNGNNSGNSYPQSPYGQSNQLYNQRDPPTLKRSPSPLDGFDRGLKRIQQASPPPA